MEGADDSARYWDDVYRRRAPDEVSWFERDPTTSLELVQLLAGDCSAAVVDVGGGASSLADRLVERGFTDVTVLDISRRALADARSRLGTRALDVHWLRRDVLTWRPGRRFDLWHDRAVFHFLTEPADRVRYVAVLRAALRPGGSLVVGTFAEDGPSTCSGLAVAGYSPDGLLRALGLPVDVAEVRRELHVTPAGDEQPFTWVAGTLAAHTGAGRRVGRGGGG